MNIRNRLQRLERQRWAERIAAMVAWARTLPPAERARLRAKIKEHLVKKGIIPASEPSNPPEGETP
jgi:hypothetical protein